MNACPCDLFGCVSVTIVMHGSSDGTFPKLESRWLTKILYPLHGGLSSASIYQNRKRLKLHAYNLKLMFDAILSVHWKETCIELEIRRGEKKYNIDGLTMKFGRLDWQTIINVCRTRKKLKGHKEAAEKEYVNERERLRNMMRYEEQAHSNVIFT